MKLEMIYKTNMIQCVQSLTPNLTTQFNNLTLNMKTLEELLLNITKEKELNLLKREKILDNSLQKIMKELKLNLLMITKILEELFKKV